MLPLGVIQASREKTQKNKSVGNFLLLFQREFPLSLSANSPIKDDVARKSGERRSLGGSN